MNAPVPPVAEPAGDLVATPSPSPDVIADAAYKLTLVVTTLAIQSVMRRQAAEAQAAA